MFDYQSEEKHFEQIEETKSNPRKNTDIQIFNIDITLSMSILLPNYQ